MLRMAAVHQKEKEEVQMQEERKQMEIEEELSKELDKIARQIPIRHRGKAVRPNMFKKYNKKYYDQIKKKIPTNRSTVAGWTPKPAPQRIPKKIQPKFHGRHSSDFEDVNDALARINRR